MYDKTQSNILFLKNKGTTAKILLKIFFNQFNVENM